MKLRPRFSLRTLAIVLTLICVYFGAWEVTKRYGVPEIGGPGRFRVYDAGSPGPLIVWQNELDWQNAAMGIRCPTRYYVWLFGLKVILPYQSEWHEPV